MQVRSLPARLADLLVYAIPPVAVVLLLSPMLSAPFGILDDHTIVWMTGPDGRVWPWELPGVLAAFNWFGERFRPGWIVLQATEAMLWGDLPVLWYVSRAALAVATIAAAMTLARDLPPLAVAAVAIMPFAGPHAEAWYRLGPQEAYAMPMLLGGLALFRHRPWVGVALLLGAGLTKESFAAALPVFVGGWWFVERRWSCPLVVLALGTAALCAAVAATQLVGNFYGNDRTPDTVLATAGAFAALLAATTVWVIPALSAWRHPIMLGAGALLVTQAVVYAGGPFEGRYLAPAVVGGMGIAIVGLRRSGYPSVAATIMLAVMLAVMVPQVQRAAHWAEASRIFQAWIAEVDAHPGHIFIERVPENSELGLSVRRYLTWPRPAGECAEVVFTGTETGRCVTVFRAEGAP